MVIVNNFKWLYLNKDFDPKLPEQYLKWGNIRAKYISNNYITVLTFYYKNEKLKRYETNTPSYGWVNSCILKFLDSKPLDMMVRQEDDPRYLSEIREKYEELTS